MCARNSVSRTAVDRSLEAAGKPSMVCTLRITEWRARIRDFGASFLMLPNTGGHGLKGFEAC